MSEYDKNALDRWITREDEYEDEQEKAERLADEADYRRKAALEDGE